MCGALKWVRVSGLGLPLAGKRKFVLNWSPNNLFVFSSFRFPSIPVRVLFEAHSSAFDG